MKTKNMIVCMALLVAMPAMAKESITAQASDANGSVVMSLLGIKRVKGSDNTCTMTLKHVEAFDRIDLKVSADVEYRQSTDGKTGVTVTVAENLADLVEVTSRNGRLTVSYTSKYKNLVISNSRLKIVASSPSLSAVTISSSGDVELKGDVRSESLSLTINGSGDIDARSLICNYVSVDINGSGDVDLAGKAERASLNINGSGDIDSEKLLCRQINASVNGSGDIDCYAAEELNACVNGSGEITYSGRPKVTGNRVKHK